MSVRTVLAGCLVVAALAGCGGGGDPTGAPPADTAPVVLRDATLRPGQPLPTPVGAPLLVLSGVDTPTGTAPLDRPTLDRLSQVAIRVYEPWVKRDLDFRGVWLADVLAVAGTGPVGSIRITALDDYAVSLTAADLRAGGILLATSDGEGRPIPLDEGGPTRIVFQRGTRAGANADQWIWSLRTIDVR